MLRLPRTWKDLEILRKVKGTTMSHSEDDAEEVVHKWGQSATAPMQGGRHLAGPLLEDGRFDAGKWEDAKKLDY
ncbi:hypothetical protein Y032_0032g2510 [Ancylostoma ceylanicum]|uniref:Uncharacterized protein n=1 Tax=Ancylostoma ceylanicum TaxID=53326 RepID=A0A016UQP1_9BILA|nr:hypothetical protein Y032_0032g2510 [Ancylostoma ceylanicum]